MSERRFTGALILVLLMSTAGTALAGKTEVAKIMKAAEKEGEVRWMSTLKDREAAPFIKAFNKEYPNIKVTYERQRGAPAMERLIRELTSGTAVADAIQVHGDYEQVLLDMDVMEKVNWADFGVLPELTLGDSRMVGMFVLPYVFIYNSNLVKREDAPKTWGDYLNPKWKGKFVVDSRPSSLLFLTSVWGPEKVLKYAAGLAKNNPISVRGQTQTMTLMAAGDYTLTNAGYLSSAVPLVAKGAPLAWNIPDVIPLNWGEFAILKGAEHPNAAKVFLGWVGSKGYKLMDEVNWGRSAPYGGTRTQKEFKGKTLAWPPTRQQIPDRQEFDQKILKALGNQS